MATFTFRDIDYNTRINGSLLVGLSSNFSDNLTVSGLLAAGDIADINLAIKSKFDKVGGEVDGNVTITGNLTVEGDIIGVDLTQYYTKANLQTSGGGSVHWGNLTNIPSASTTVTGIVRLNNTTTSTSTTQAATANALKIAYDLANSKWTYNAATIQGVKVNNATNADTVNDLTVETAVPPGAIFTDTIYVHPSSHSLSIITETATLKIMTSAERTKLAGIAESANNYIHPASHSLSMITETTTKKIMTDIERIKLASIEEGANLYTHPTTHSLDEITETSSKAIMTMDERSKLFGVEANANNYIHPNEHAPSIITQDINNRFVTDAQIATWNSKSTLALGETGTTAYRGDRGKIAYDHSQTSHNFEIAFAKNTAFNKNFETSTANIKMNGIASVGTSANVARADHVHAVDTSRASTAIATQLANGLLSSIDKTKLDGVTAGANKTQDSATNGNILIDGAEVNVYTHPTGTNPHGTTKADINLENVDNTADADKSVLSASKLTTARIITLSGDVEGAVTTDLSGNPNIVTSYKAADVLDKLKTVDGSGSGLDADTVDGMNTSATGSPSTIAARDNEGNLTSANAFNYGAMAYTKYNPTTKSIDFVFN